MSEYVVFTVRKVQSYNNAAYPTEHKSSIIKRAITLSLQFRGTFIKRAASILLLAALTFSPACNDDDTEVVDGDMVSDDGDLSEIEDEEYAYVDGDMPDPDGDIFENEEDDLDFEDDENNEIDYYEVVEGDMTGESSDIYEAPEQSEISEENDSEEESLEETEDEDTDSEETELESEMVSLKWKN